MNKRKVLNLGSASFDMKMAWYKDFEVVSMDIDEESGADIIGDARELIDVFSHWSIYDEMRFDAVHVSHLLEHFYARENETVLEGIHHVLKDDGMVDIWVPDVMASAKKGLGFGIDATIYQSEAGAINLHQILYGADDNPFMSHHQGFDLKRLARVVGRVFPVVMQAFRGEFEIGVLGFKQQPTWQLDLFKENEDE